MLKKLFVTLLASVALMGSAWAAVDLNTATQQQLEALNGIGPEKAKDIIDYRSKNGAFKTTEEIMKVPGIKEGTYNKIKADITVNGKVAKLPSAKAASGAKPASAPAKK
ncbi:ComEA family DNA-binding protein [Chitinibacter sp. S2-10]|uniref:ComEA family DNA-binding protein n=1 Tax=Chitinibacter sp. S2-10 TaxID=3373597 RepID=UPI0039774ADA